MVTTVKYSSGRRNTVSFERGTGVYLNDTLDTNYGGGSTTGPWTWVVPQGVYSIYVDMCGAGGGGGGAYNAGGAGGGGGGGACIKDQEVYVRPGQSLVITCPAGGTGGTAGAAGTAGGSGGGGTQTTISGLDDAYGVAGDGILAMTVGFGGSAGAVTNGGSGGSGGEGQAAGGTGGAGAGGNSAIGIRGVSGGGFNSTANSGAAGGAISNAGGSATGPSGFSQFRSAIANAGPVPGAGHGASSFWGLGGLANNTGAGAAASGFGAGGAGGTGTANGGAGSPGLVRIRYVG